MLSIVPWDSSGQLSRWLHTPGARARAKAEAAALIRQRGSAIEESGVELRFDTRWGDPATEIRKAAKQASSDIVVLEANNPNRVQTLLVGDCQRDVVTTCPTSIFIARPEITPSRSIIVFLNSFRDFPLAIEKLRDLEIPAGTGIYFASFTSPVRLSAGMFFTLREYLRKRDEALNRASMEITKLFLSAQARHLVDAGLQAEISVTEDELLNGLTRLVEEVAAGLVIVPDTRLPSPDQESTRRAARIARGLSCSVLVAR